MSKQGGKTIVKAIAVTLSLVIICLFFSEITERSRKSKREARVLELVIGSAAEFDLSPALVLAIIEAESDFHPDAISRAGAMGLMQLMPDTFSFVWSDLLSSPTPSTAIFDPAVNIRCGCCYFAYLQKRFGNTETALAAYNAGEGRVTDWLNDPILSPNGKLQSIPFAETRAYLQRVLTARRRYEEKYQFNQVKESKR